MFYYERKLRHQGFKLIAGVDEAGRGPLAGPVVAAAVILKDKHFKNRIDDSKRLTALQRGKAHREIISKSLSGLGIVDEKVIDEINISCATHRAMQLAIQDLVEKLKLVGQDLDKLHILVDGKIPLNLEYPFTCVIKGDTKSKSIASASIVAKVTRDKIMHLYHHLFPEYNFSKHKGYPTQRHKQAIKKFGLSPIHRKTFSYV